MLKSIQISLFFIYFSVFTRLLQLLYIDFYGPFFSIELNRDIGIAPFSGVLFLLFYLPLYFFTRKIKNNKDIDLVKNPVTNIPIKVIEIILIIFLLTLFISLFLNYPIPLFENLDRIIFNKMTEGTIHEFFRNQFYLITSAVAYLFYYYKIYFKKYSNFHVVILILIFVYAVLTGNRWSIFFTFFSFFLFVRFFFIQKNLVLQINLISTIRKSKLLLSIILLTIVFIIGRSLYLSFTIIRGYEDVAEVFFNRAVLENVGVFQTLYDTRDNNLHLSSFLNFSPIDENKSKAMQFLMNEISFDNQFILQIEGGQIFSGGFPDFMYYILSLYSFIPIIIVSYVFCGFIRILKLDLVRKNIFLFLLGILCIFPFFLFFTSGFIDFIFNPIWYLKLFIFLILFIYYGFSDNSKLQFN